MRVLAYSFFCLSILGLLGLVFFARSITEPQLQYDFELISERDRTTHQEPLALIEVVTSLTFPATGELTLQFGGNTSISGATWCGRFVGKRYLIQSFMDGYVASSTAEEDIMFQLNMRGDKFEWWNLGEIQEHRLAECRKPGIVWYGIFGESADGNWVFYAAGTKQ